MGYKTINIANECFTLTYPITRIPILHDKFYISMKNKIAFNDMSTALKIFCQKSWAWGRATRMINYIHIESISNFMTEVRATKWGKIIFKGE